MDFGVGRGGEIVALTGQFEAALHITRRDAASRTLRIEVPNLGHFDNPRFSPDGRRIAVSVSVAGGTHQVYVLDPAAGTSERITFSGSVEHFAWTRDGRGIVYVKGDSEIATQASDRSGGERIIWKGDSRPLAAITVSDRWIAVMASTVTPEGRHIRHPDSRPGLAGGASVHGDAIQRKCADHIAGWPMAGLRLGRDGQGGGVRRVLSRRVAREADSLDSGSSRAGMGQARDDLYYRGADGRVVEAAYTTGDRFSITSRKDVGLEDAGTSTDAADYDVSPAGDEFVTSHLGTIKARLSVLLGALPSK